MKKSILVLALALAALTACNPSLYQASAPPPARSARLDPVTNFWGVIKRYRLEVSEGVAVAVKCEHGGPCEKMKIVSENPAIAEVRIATLSSLQQVGHPYSQMQQPPSAFVIVGKAPGSTKLHLTAKGGTRVVTVSVIAAPTAVPVQTAAH